MIRNVAGETKLVLISALSGAPTMLAKQYPNYFHRYHSRSPVADIKDAPSMSRLVGHHAIVPNFRTRRNSIFRVFFFSGLRHVCLFGRIGDHD